MPRPVLVVYASFAMSCLGLTKDSFAQARPASPDSNAVLEGYADIHVHQMGNLGFGGSIIWGKDGGDPKTALSSIRPDFRRGHDIAELAARGGIWKTVAAVIDALIAHIFRHGEEGYPSFNSWPGTDRWTHQHAYKDWLFRAYQGGMRLMVMLAVNSEDEFGRGENELRILGRIPFQRKKSEGRTGNDMEALDWQIREAYELQKEIDEKAGGYGKGWYRIVRDPEAADKVIKEGKLAVILGTELQHLFNCDMDRPLCTEEQILEGLNRLEAMGVNYVFPVHHKLNQFGGPAKFVVLNNGPSGPCPVEPKQYKHPCSTVGLMMPTGEFLVNELMAHGMLIDTEHLSERAFYDTMKIAEQRNYPVLAGHVIPWHLGSMRDQKSKTELARRNEDLRRILKLGGIVAPMLGTPTGEYLRNGKAVVHVCKPSETGSIDQWANAYLLLRDLGLEAGLQADSGHVAMGTDWNGFAGWPKPGASCASQSLFQVTYPFWLPKGLKKAAVDPVDRLDVYEFPSGRQWNFNQVGAAHAGMVPDFLQGVTQLRANGIPLAPQLEPFYRSAREVVNLWTKVRNRQDSWSQHHLRWTPQHAFDVFDYDPNDGDRTVYALDGRHPICRTRSGHMLGYLREGVCVLVDEPPPPRTDPVQVPVYHSGRCLTVNSHRPLEEATQYPCGTAMNQRWHFRQDSAGHWRIVNSLSGYCLTALPRASGDDGKVVQAQCNKGNAAQEWDVHRTGNTFQLKPVTLLNLCAEVKGQSRETGAPVRQNACNGASNQLWSIETLRQWDYERLCQADFDKHAWLRSPSPDYPYAVEVRDGSRICRATDARWIGIINGRACVGRTYSGEPATTTEYEGLYQMP